LTRAGESFGRILVDVGPHPDDAIGENLMKLPMLRAMKAAWPECRITWMHGEGPWLFNGPLKDVGGGMIDRFEPASAVGGNWLDVLKRPGRDLGGPFDLIVDTQRNVQRTLALRRIPHRVFVSATWRFALSDRRPPKDAPTVDGISLAENLLRLQSAASGTWQPPDPATPVPDRFEEKARELLPGGETYVGFAPGAGNVVRGKCWPLDNFLAAAEAEIAAGRRPVFILGPQETAIADTVRARLSGALIPDLSDSIALTVALGGRLSAAVANCSGTGHMLAAGGAAMVSLFGPTNARKFRPYARTVQVLKAQDFGADNMEAIPLDAVTRSIHTAVCNSVSDR